MSQETRAENSESLQKALKGLEKMEQHFAPDYYGRQMKGRTKEEEAYRQKVRAEAGLKENFLRSFRERLQAGQPVDTEKAFTMYFEMLVSPDGQYDQAELQDFMASLTIAAKETGSFFIRLDGQGPTKEQVETSIRETRQKFGL